MSLRPAVGSQLDVALSDLYVRDDLHKHTYLKTLDKRAFMSLAYHHWLIRETLDLNYFLMDRYS